MSDRYNWILQRIEEARVDFNPEYDILDWVQGVNNIPNEALPPIYIEDILRGTESVGLLEFFTR